MPLWKNYYLAESIPDALEKLSIGARLIAGGTDLLLEIQQGATPPVDHLVDVTRISELNALELRGQDLFVGAAVPLNRIVASSLVKEHAQALAEACDLIGGPQVRNTATLGGNVAHALPAADGTIALLALDARAEAVSLEGWRTAALENLFLGPRESILEAKKEILVGFYIPFRESGQASAFKRVMRPQGVALPVLNLAVWLQRSKKMIVDVHLAIGPSGPIPIRARAAESVLRGEEFDKKISLHAFQALFEDVRLRTSPYRATENYRRHLAKVLLEETLEIAWQRAG
jgi:carbon-monoxide dehydrogenase medium subunit